MIALSGTTRGVPVNGQTRIRQGILRRTVCSAISDESSNPQLSAGDGLMTGSQHHLVAPLRLGVADFQRQHRKPHA
jgi:hypothetical protein